MNPIAEFLTSLLTLPSSPLLLRPSGTIEEPSQLNFIYRGFVRLLNNVHLSESSYLPFSVTRMAIEQVRLFLSFFLILSFFFSLFLSLSLSFFLSFFLILSLFLSLTLNPSRSFSLLPFVYLFLPLSLTAFGMCICSSSLSIYLYQFCQKRFTDSVIFHTNCRITYLFFTGTASIVLEVPRGNSEVYALHTPAL